MSVILQLENYAPAGWSNDEWQNVVVGIHNVWGNVIWTPDSATVDELASLQRQLEEVLRRTTPENSVDRIDEIYQLLLRSGRSREFIEQYRDYFHQAVDIHDASP